jgi:hypothetical protein
VAREAALKQEVDLLNARIRDLEQRLYGKRSEKGTTTSEAQAGEAKPSRPRGHQRGSPGHSRTPRPDLPVVEEYRSLPPEKQVCPCCRLPLAPFPGTENSEIVEIQVQAYVRRIKRERYRKTCRCPGVPGVITAPPAPRWLSKSGLGISVWVEVRLRKYLYAAPTYRLCVDLAWIILVCDRYSAYPCWAKGYPKGLLAFCWAHVRRDFLDAAKAWPDLANWMHAWVEAIGELYHLHGLRLEVWDEELALDRQSAEFQARHQTLSSKLTAMAERRDLCLQDASLHVTVYPPISWAGGLIVFYRHSGMDAGIQRQGW